MNGEVDTTRQIKVLFPATEEEQQEATELYEAGLAASGEDRMELYEEVSVIPPSPFRDRKSFYQIKDAGQRCKPGETTAETNCISGEGNGKGPSKQPVAELQGQKKPDQEVVKPKIPSNKPPFRAYDDEDVRKPLDPRNTPREFLNRNDKVIKLLSDEQRNAIHQYTGKSYKKINKELRQCPESLDCLSASVRKTVEFIKESLKAAGNLEEPITVFRKIHLEGKDLEDFTSKMEAALDRGGEVQMPGFVSTSLSFLRLQGNIKMEIRVKTGMYVAPISSHKGDQEFLQDHGTRYRVTGIKEVMYEFPRIRGVTLINYAEETKTGFLYKTKVFQLEEI